MHDNIRRILKAYGGLSVDAHDIGNAANLFELGLDSFGTVDVMVAMETEFGLEFRPEFMTRATFASIASLAAAVVAMQQERAET